MSSVEFSSQYMAEKYINQKVGEINEKLNHTYWNYNFCPFIKNTHSAIKEYKYVIEWEVDLELYSRIKDEVIGGANAKINTNEDSPDYYYDKIDKAIEKVEYLDT